MSGPDGSSPRLAVINGLRGWAILGVIYHHTLAWLVSPLGADAPAAGWPSLSAHTLLRNGWLGVNLFFILSGFVLALPYARGDRDIRAPGGVRAFYRQRAARLLPPYYFFLVAVMFLHEPSDLMSLGFLRDVWRMVTFTFVFDRWSFFPRFNLTLWSLGVEVWFSVLFPLVLLTWRKLGLGAVLVPSLLGCLLVRILGAALHPGEPSHLDFVKDGILGRFDDFVVGVALATLYARKRLPGAAAAALLLSSGLALLFCVAAAWDGMILRALPYATAPYLNLATQIAFSAILLALLGGAPRLLAAPFTARPVQLAGMMSYSPYLWHTVGVQGPFWDGSDIPVYLVLVFLVSAATYRFVEFPRRTVRELFAEYPRRVRGESAESSAASAG
jgi:peptidoglycan/LPS O-acetylase OafA/YrhL